MKEVVWVGYSRQISSLAQRLDSNVRLGLEVVEMLDAVEPTVGEFFASPSGVCVYVNVRGRPFRVHFDSPDGTGLAQETTHPGADEALAVATAARDRHKIQLAPLFERVALELASRTRS